jgi:hypothetical protein
VKLSIFSQLEREGGPATNGRRFEVILVSLHYDNPTSFDVLGVVHDVSTHERTHRLFEHEPDDEHAQRATRWVLQLLDLEEAADVLRAPALLLRPGCRCTAAEVLAGVHAPACGTGRGERP